MSVERGSFYTSPRVRNTHPTSLIKAVLFDYGGVVVDGGKVGGLANNLATELEIPDDHAERLMGYGLSMLQRGLISEDEFWEGLEQVHGSPIPATKRDVWASTEDQKPRAEVIAFRDDLNSRGIHTAVLSNTEPNMAAALREHGGYDGFQSLILSCEVGYVKPQLEIYQAALDQLGDIKPDEVLLIDDQEKYLEPARSLGIKTVFAQTPQQLIADAEALINPK